MRAVRIVDGTPVLEEIERPEPGDGVRVRVVASSICGSDLHLIDAGFADGMILGHEFCGYAPDGTAVAVEPMASCGTCPSCLDGYLGTCATGASFYGIGLPGGMADEVVVQSDALVPLPSGLPLAAGSLVEPLAVAAHGLDRARVTDHDRVLVIGAGPIGLATVAMLAHRGITPVVSARHPHQAEAAERLGGIVATANGGRPPDGGYDVVMDAAATSASLAEAIQRVRPRGRVGLVGTIWGDAALTTQACLREAEILPAITYRCRTPDRHFLVAAEALVDAPHIADTLITHRFPLDGCADAFATAADRAAGAIKVAFDVSAAR